MVVLCDGSARDRGLVDYRSRGKLFLDNRYDAMLHAESQGDTGLSSVTLAEPNFSPLNYHADSLCHRLALVVSQQLNSQHG